MDLSLALFLLLIILTSIIFLIAFVIYFSSSTFPTIEEYKKETTFCDSSSNSLLKFPSLDDDKISLCSLSVIVPAYNEELRLPPMLEEAFEYLEKRSDEDTSFTYELIIVDDGSKDSTSKVALQYNKKYGSDKIRVLTLAKNRGKGGAVRLGMLRARGEILLFADADGATKFSDLDKVEENLRILCKDESKISESLAVVCGSRAHLEEESVASRSFFRTILMYGFHFLVWFFTVREVKDTQCGFKLLTRRAAKILFGSLHVERWAFDVEMLYIAQSLGIPIGEVAVTWNEIEGSKVTPVISWIQMGFDLLLIWFRYKVGAWKIKGEFNRNDVSILD